MIYKRTLKYSFGLIVCLISFSFTSFLYYLHRTHVLIGVSDRRYSVKKIVPGGLFIERIEHLNKICGGVNATSNAKRKLSQDVLDHILVDSKHRLLYCYVPKVACTNWKRIFMILSGQANSTDVLSIPANLAHSRNLYMTLNNFSVEDVDYFLGTYTKFMLVRHPFERLLSAYRNKLERNYLNSKYFQSRLGRYIIKRYRLKPTNSSLKNGDDVTFEEFTAYLTASDSNDFNEHWKPIHNLCEPCRIEYDFIGKYETLVSDSNSILESVGVSNFSFPYGVRTATTLPDLKKYFSKLTPERIRQLYSIYQLDFKLFSYKLEDILGYEIG